MGRDNVEKDGKVEGDAACRQRDREDTSDLVGETKKSCGQRHMRDKDRGESKIREDEDRVPSTWKALSKGIVEQTALILRGRCGMDIVKEPTVHQRSNVLVSS